ncbi:MAG: hypothetical protein H6730_03500 [Deltaproteobacteria bacterium]|nr:hypothetical protein [Deltaproteobacteria bacterium]
MTSRLAVAWPVDGAAEVEVVLPAARLARVPDPLPPHAEPELYVRGVALGGFDAVSARVGGAECPVHLVWLPDGSAAFRCPLPAGVGTVEVEVQATLRVPERYGPLSRLGRQLTLGAGWFGVPRAPGGPAPALGYHVELTAPPGVAVVLGDAYSPPVPEPAARRVTWSGAARQVPLVVLPPWTGSAPAAGGRARVVSPRLHRVDDPVARLWAEQVRFAVTDGLHFLERQGLPVPSVERPLVVVEAPLRHDLAKVADGVVLVSDRAFRLLPFERFLRFHRYPLLRAVFGAVALAGRTDPEAALAADAVGGFQVDAYVASRAGKAEDAFDVLSLWSFIPAVDSLLYAPQLPFVGAYFRLIREEDPLSPNLLDPPRPGPPGKVIYEKLLDRFGEPAVQGVLRAVAHGATLEDAAAALGPEGPATVAAWSGAYPDVQYVLTSWGSAQEGQAYRATVRFTRTGAPVAEPVTLRLIDEEGEARLVQAGTSTAVLRTVTATLAAPLARVELDPYGRLAEAPSVEVPSPKLDNRSHAKWRFLLNSFNVLYSPSANNLDTALDVGFSRVRDVRWRFAARAAYAPEAITLSGRATYYFGAPTTADGLSQWVGMVLGGDYLRPEFAGTEESALALSGSLYYGYDDRKTAWAPEAGLGLRASLGISHSFGAPAADAAVTRDAVNLTLRALRSWRLNAAHQLSVRASAGAYLYGTPRAQLQYAVGGRRNLRGYVVDDEVGRMRGILSGEWVHLLLADLDVNAAWLVWITRLDGALYADLGVLGDSLSDLGARPPRADVGYGFRIYLDYFGVRPGVMAVDIAFPLVDEAGRLRVGPPAVYIDFAQSFFAF